MLRRIARPLLATWFVSESSDALRHPAPHAEQAAAQVRALAAHVPTSANLPALDRARTATADDLVWPIRVHAGLTLLAGLALASHKAPRFAGATLAVLTAPLAIAARPARHGWTPTWLPERWRQVASMGATSTTDQTPEQQRAAKTRWLALVSLTGAALLVAADTAGKPSVQWRIARARRDHAKATAHPTAR